MKKPAAERHLQLYSGRDLIGTVRATADMAEAFDARGNRLGEFKNARAAIAAINTSLSGSCVGDSSAARRDGSP